MSADVEFTWEEARAVVRSGVLAGHETSAIHRHLTEAYGANSPTLRWTQKWAARFRDGRTILADDPRSGRPQIEGLDDSVASVLQDQPFASTRDIATILGCSYATVHSILTRELGMRKSVSHWFHTSSRSQTGKIGFECPMLCFRYCLHHTPGSRTSSRGMNRGFTMNTPTMADGQLLSMRSSPEQITLWAQRKSCSQ